MDSLGDGILFPTTMYSPRPRSCPLLNILKKEAGDMKPASLRRTLIAEPCLRYSAPVLAHQNIKQKSKFPEPIQGKISVVPSFLLILHQVGPYRLGEKYLAIQSRVLDRVGN
jgi:hypothetical protein